MLAAQQLRNVHLTENLPAITYTRTPCITSANPFAFFILWPFKGWLIDSLRHGAVPVACALF